MNILVIGGGAREHCLVDKLNNNFNKIWAFPGNPGIFEIAYQTDIQINSFDEIARFCIEKKIDLVVVGPEQPLADGIVDFLEFKGIKVFGPSKLASQIESSKAFAKQFMKKFDIPTADFAVFHKTEMVSALEFCKKLNGSIVVKADGLAAGKGVTICKSYQDAEITINEYFEGKFGNASEKIVIEEFLEGEEASIFVVTDGKDYLLLPSAQDHKRVFDGDNGPNTGGMGAYSPAPIISRELLDEIEETIVKPTLSGLEQLGRLFKGCLYVGLMIDKEQKPYVIEYNCRFGDPETQAVLQLIEGDFDKLLMSVANHKLDKSSIKIKENQYASCVVVCSGGYPEKYKVGYEIVGLENINKQKVKIYQAGTKLENNKLLTNGGRVICLVSQATSLKASLSNIYEELPKIHFENIHYRRDIGYRALKLFEGNG